ncbi:hypothetical protein JVT61DRAFT_4614 [Boletus reticuloceps]|uniref:Uncharacterized protein n=1 Tax=Boletus reticuloceps TaxID=495285 RepID=A0A8I2YLR0_9AGAM|nr:hypothetical protein JVT61DRAFT_4614 [Boletus reticuloceps]
MSQDDFSQTVVNQAVEAVRDIISNHILALTPICEHTQSWSARIQEMREQLEFVRSVIHDGVAIPHFLVSLDMHLAGNVSLNLDHPWLELHGPAPIPVSPTPATTAHAPFPVPTSTSPQNPPTQIGKAAKLDKGKAKAKQEADKEPDNKGNTTHQTRRRAKSVVCRDEKEKAVTNAMVDKGKGKGKDKQDQDGDNKKGRHRTQDQDKQVKQHQEQGEAEEPPWERSQQ